MKIFLSAIEGSVYDKDYDKTRNIVDILIEHGVKMKYNLTSFYYVRKKLDVAKTIIENSEEVLIDSGAHSFQKGVKVDWLEYTKQYAEFIKEYDRPNIVGYFEMDVDNIIGYDKVLELRKILESVSDKIIPVWHRNRGIDDFKKMCENYAGKVVAITGFKNEDIKDEQYLMFLKYAKKFNCKVHCLGMTRKKVLDTVPFDYVDSSSWVQCSIYGRIDGRGKVTKENYNELYKRNVYIENYKIGIEMQEHYYNKWRKVNKD